MVGALQTILPSIVRRTARSVPVLQIGLGRTCRYPPRVPTKWPSALIEASAIAPVELALALMALLEMLASAPGALMIALVMESV